MFFILANKIGDVVDLAIDFLASLMCFILANEIGDDCGISAFSLPLLHHITQVRYVMLPSLYGGFVPVLRIVMDAFLRL